MARSSIFYPYGWHSAWWPESYSAGCIILVAAPCTAMVFVWSHLTKGDAAYALVQVSVTVVPLLVGVLLRTLLLRRCGQAWFEELLPKFAPGRIQARRWLPWSVFWWKCR